MDRLKLIAELIDGVFERFEDEFEKEFGFQPDTLTVKPTSQEYAAKNEFGVEIGFTILIVMESTRLAYEIADTNRATMTFQSLLDNAVSRANKIIKAKY